VLFVVGTISTAVWLYEIAKNDEHPINTWLVVILAVLLVSAVLWGYGRARDHDAASVVHHHHYSAPATVMYGVQAGAPARESVGPPTPPSGKKEVVKLADYVEYPPNSPPVIRNRDFRNVILRGPILLGVRSAQFVDVGFGIANNDPDTMFFVMGEDEVKIAVAAVDNCSFIACQTEQVALIGTREQINRFRQEIGSLKSSVAN
jgi:hypothetical protein